MKRIAAFVDAGYFWVQLCTLITGAYSSRAQVRIAYAELRTTMLAEIAQQLPDGDLLRIYWYDGPGMTGKTPEHYDIDKLDDFKLRLGTRNGEGKQKGVDGMIIADMVSLTQQKAITHAMLVSGDADMSPGVVAAQSMGLRVHLLSLGSPAATSPFLAAEVDLKRRWDIDEVKKFATNIAALVIAVGSSAVPGASGLAGTVAAPAVLPITMVAIAQMALAQIKVGPKAAALASLAPGDFALPREVDGELLAVGRTQLGRVLVEAEKRALRTAFRSLIV